MRKRFLNIYSQIEWTYDFLSDDSNDFSFGLFFILRMAFFYVVYLRMVFSISDSQTLFTKGQFPRLYYMPACLSRLPAGMYLPSLPSLTSRTEILHFVQNDGPGGKAPWCLASAFFPCTNDTIATPPPCHFDRSGEISLLHGTSRIGAGDLSTQSLNRVQVHLPPLRHAAPLEMTDATGRLASLEKDGNAVTPHCHFDRSGEISLLHGTSRTTAGDLSTQSFNRVQVHLPPLRHAAPLEMTEATGCTIVISKAAKK